MFGILINKKIDIALIQEIHSTKESMNKWQKKWQGKSFWNSGKTPKASGIAILLKKDLKINTFTSLKGNEGRILTLNFSIEKQNYQIINIYGPTKNSEKSKFYQTLKNYIDSQQNLIIGRDFNMVEDILLDRKGGHPNNTHLLGLTHLKKIKQTNNLVETWRKENPHKNLFTYHNKNKQIHSRIDRFYIKNNQKIKDIQNFPNGLSDHDTIHLTITIKKNNTSGKGHWKLNTTILKQTIFQKLFKQFWEDWLKEKKAITNLLTNGGNQVNYILKY